MKSLIIINITIFLLSSYEVFAPYIPEDSISKKEVFEKNWIPNETNWHIAYDEVIYTNGPLIIRNRDSEWIINFVGSMTMENDSISVNQEMGFDNRCKNLGKISVGDSNIVVLGNNEYLLNIKSVNEIEFNGIKFITTNKLIRSRYWCN